VARALEDATATLVGAGFTVDYVALVDAETLVADPAPGRRRQLLAAARIGNTRLIDNLAVDPA
jgi:pantoate--beta-alanine ligase